MSSTNYSHLGYFTQSQIKSSDLFFITSQPTSVRSNIIIC